MTHILISIIGFLLAIGLLVTVHESGHFWVARLFGIRVLRFSIGFGRPIFHWYDKSGTEYVIAGIPLGGYVSLFGEKGQVITRSEHHEAYSHKPVWVRMAVLVAGPFFNLLFAFLAYWLMFLIGIASLAPILGNVPKGSIADLAGLHAKQEIISIENKNTPSWEAVSIAVLNAMGKEQNLDIQVREVKDSPEAKDKPIENHILDLSSLEKHNSDGDVLKDLGFTPSDPIPAIVAQTLPGTPAEKAGLQTGDRILSVDNHPVHSRTELIDYVHSKSGEMVKLQVVRQDQNLSIDIQPMTKILDNGKSIGFMGIEFQRGQKIPPEYLRLERYGVVQGFWQALKRTSEYTILTFQVLKKMLVGTLSVKQISGPIAIAEYAGYTVSIGFEYFLSFLAVISIGLGVINLLPIPLLDGGQLMYCFWELITGRPVSDQAQRVGIVIGGGILMAITILAFYNDIVRFIVH